MDSFKIGKSKISGRGVFATRNIKKGEKVHTLSGKSSSLKEILGKVERYEERASDPLGTGWEKYLDLDKLSRIFNHSCNPNCYVKGRSDLIALKNIKKGDEITYDYSTTMHDNEEKIWEMGFKKWTRKCKCGTRNCRGIIDQFKTLPKSRQNFYLRNKYAPNFVLEHFGFSAE